jgi:hypothetical protein
MDQINTDLDQDEEILAYTVSDEALEAAASGSEMGGAPTFFLPTGFLQCC